MSVTDETPHETSQELVPFGFAERVWPFEWMGQFLEALAKVPVITAACEIVGISQSRVYQCKDEYPAFAEAWVEAMVRGPDLLEALAWSYATKGVTTTTTRTKMTKDDDGEVVIEVVQEETTAPSPATVKFMLARWKREYQPKVAHEHSGSGGGAIEHDHRHEVVRRPTRERMLELVQLAREFELPEGTDALPVIEAGTLPKVDES